MLSPKNEVQEAPKFVPGDAVLKDAGWAKFEATFLSYGSHNMVEDRRWARIRFRHGASRLELTATLSLASLSSGDR